MIKLGKNGLLLTSSQKQRYRVMFILFMPVGLDWKCSHPLSKRYSPIFQVGGPKFRTQNFTFARIKKQFHQSFIGNPPNSLGWRTSGRKKTTCFQSAKFYSVTSRSFYHALPCLVECSPIKCVDNSNKLNITYAYIQRTSHEVGKHHLHTYIQIRNIHSHKNPY